MKILSWNINWNIKKPVHPQIQERKLLIVLEMNLPLANYDFNINAKFYLIMESTQLKVCSKPEMLLLRLCLLRFLKQ